MKKQSSDEISKMVKKDTYSPKTDSLTSITSIQSKGCDSNEGKPPKRSSTTFYDKMQNVKNLASSIVSSVGSTVQEKVSRIDEVLGDPLLQVVGIKEKDKKKCEKSNSSKSNDSTKLKSDLVPATKKESKTLITWRIDKEVYEKLETKRKKQVRRCLQAQDYQYAHQYVQHKNSIIRSNLAIAGLEKSTSELKLFNNQLDQLTDYELMEILKMMTMTDKFKFRRVSKRFRNCINMLFQNETVFALIERKQTINFRLDQITNFSIDPLYMNQGELTASLVDNVNKHMTKLNSIVIAYPIEFDLYLELIRRRSLVNLILCGSLFENKHMNALPDYTVNLSILNLDQCMIDDWGIEVIVRECGRVLNIRLSHCKQITGTFLEHLPTNFACLELNNCEKFQLENWRLLLVKDRRQLTTIAIDNIPFNNQLVEGMVKFDKLVAIDLRFHKSQDYKFRSISMCTRLEVLKIADYSNPPCFVDDVFNEIQRGCDRLLKIAIECDPNRVYLTDSVFSNIAENCAKITTIRLVNTTNLTEKTLVALSKLKLLMELKLDNLTFNDAVIIRTLPDFRALTKIKLYRCVNITNQLPEQLFKSFCTRSVWYYISLRSNPKITKVDLTHKPTNVIFECN